MQKAIIILLCCLVTQVQAQTKDKKQKKTLLESRRNHKQRIQEGIKTGDLSKKETAAIVQLEKKIKQAMYKARQNDGRIDEQERAEIKKMQLELDKMIEDLKTNGTKRKEEKPSVD
jgi:uncharacterized membrane protein YebE (DUF533 family)